MFLVEERKNIQILKHLPQSISSKALMTTILTEDLVSVFNGELGVMALSYVICVLILVLLFWHLQISWASLIIR